MTRNLDIQYDEDEAWTKYVLDHYAPLMTELEYRLIRVIATKEKADAIQSEVVAAKLRSLGRLQNDDDAAKALESGPRECRRNIRDRLMRDYPAKIEVNRCPKCDRVARTPRSRQCFWCGNDWHEPQDNGL